MEGERSRKERSGDTENAFSLRIELGRGEDVEDIVGSSELIYF